MKTEVQWLKKNRDRKISENPVTLAIYVSAFQLCKLQPVQNVKNQFNHICKPCEGSLYVCLFIMLVASSLGQTSIPVLQHVDSCSSPCLLWLVAVVVMIFLLNTFVHLQTAVWPLLSQSGQTLGCFLLAVGPSALPLFSCSETVSTSHYRSFSFVH